MTLTTIRHYRILEQLDDGASGLIYKAENSRDNRHVALKFLPFELKEDPKARERFIDDAQAASSLDHPNICTVHEIGEAEDGRMFAALAYYKGKTLKRTLQDGPLPMSYALDVARQLAAGLGEAHRHDLVHRDLVPANVLMCEDGQARILDFGLGKQVSQGGLTQIGWSFGTPEYMSPELIQGAEANATADLWSLGVLLYEMISGKQPFTGANLAGVLTAIQSHDPPPLRDTRPETPADLDIIIRRLLAKQPDDRYPSCEELLQDLGGPGSEPKTGAFTTGKAADQVKEVASVPPERSDESQGISTAEGDKPNRTILWVVLALLAAIVVMWLLIAGSSDGSLLVPQSAGENHVTASFFFDVDSLG